MGVFDDTRRLFRQSFGWGLASYNPVADDPDNDSEPDDVDSISVYVDEKGVVNVAKQLTLYESTDPIDGGVEHTYSKDNLFIAGLNKALDTFPVGGIIDFPTRRFYAPRTQRGVALSSGAIRYPTDTPPGFVPCIGQLLKYPDGTEILVPDLTPQPTLGNPFIISSVTRKLMRVPEGWETPDPALRRGRDSEELDRINGLFFFFF